MDPKKIKITCDTTDMMPLNSLESFQGELKIISDEELAKLESAIIKYGFSFPIFVWGKSILDGHQRIKAVKRLLDAGYKLEGNMLPVAWIKAENRREAAEKLLLINSRYAKIDQSGFDFFIEDFEIDLEDFGSMLEIPEIDFSFEFENDVNDEPTQKEEILYSVDEPRHRVENGDKYLIDDRHILICSNLTSDWKNWKSYLKGDDLLFIPYPSIYILQSEKIAEFKLLIVQPDEFIFGKMLDIHCDLHGEDSIKKI